MPDIVVHNFMGKKVLEEIRPEISDLINYDIYRFAIMGPDIFMFHRCFTWPIKSKINKRSSVMHKVRTGDFLIELANRVKQNKSNELFSYLAGFLCHYAMDCNAHPYVNQYKNNERNMHGMVERRLDQIVLTRQGRTIKDRPITKDLLPAFLPKTLRTDIEEVYDAVYGWPDSWNLLNTSYLHMRLYYWIIEDPHGLFDQTIGRLHPRAKGISYKSRLHNDLKCNWLDPVIERAVEEGKRYIESCYDYMQGNLDESALREIIGNKSYSTGRTITVNG